MSPGPPTILKPCVGPPLTAPGASTGGRTIYAIGDVHGRLDLLDPLIESIRSDALASRGSTRPAIIFLGDYVDRGVSSRGVIDRLIGLGADADFDVKALRGNHEEALLTFLEDATFGPAWCEHGGAQTLSSYGVQPPIPRAGETDWEAIRLAFIEALPTAHRRFFEDLELFAVHGDYVFVHAGLRPGVPLDRQNPRDLLWIRQPFLDWAGSFDRVVVHGHTAADAAFLGPHRIGIDTGAYATGVLTAVRLEAANCRFIQSRRMAVRST